MPGDFVLNLKHLSRSKVSIIGGTIAAVLVGYDVVNKGYLFLSFSTTVKNIVVTPLRSHVFEFFKDEIWNIKNNSVLLWDSVVNPKSLNVQESVLVDKKEESNFIYLTVNGGKELLIRYKELMIKMINFLFSDLPSFIKDNGMYSVKEYAEHYWRPMKFLFERPQTSRLQSAKTRLEQIFECLKDPDFFKYVQKMNKFYLEFKEQISTLNGEQLAELIDIFLDNPKEMFEKIQQALPHLEGDRNSKNKFDSEMIMNFARGEKIEHMKAQLYSSKIASGISEISGFLTSITPGFMHRTEEARLETNKVLGETFEKWGTNLVSWWTSSVG